MKIRLISDLHIDINAKYPLDLHENGANDAFTLVAGDISGCPRLASEWLKKNIHYGAFVSGNHDVYSTPAPIENIKDFFHKEFPLNGNITYFDNDIGVISKEIANNVLLVADVMYTDYALPIEWYNAKGNVERNMQLADPYMNRHGGMNDFNYGHCKKNYPRWNDLHPSNTIRDDVWRLCPPWYKEHHDKAFKAITDVIESNIDKQILLMTHHALSPQCLDKNYDSDNGMMNASYASDKEEWIKAHPNLRCIVSGHIHCRKQFKVGNCLYVMNALGYCDRHLAQYDDKAKEWKSWTPNCFIDTDLWTVVWEDYENEAWKEQKKYDDDKFMRLAPFFMR